MNENRPPRKHLQLKNAILKEADLYKSPLQKIIKNAISKIAFFIIKLTEIFVNETID